MRQAIEFLDSHVNYEIRPPRLRERSPFSLERIKRLLGELGNPQSTFRTVHIAGTKGKGSTATMLANMLHANGMVVGLYTSPHVVDIRERISVALQMIPEADFVRLMAKIAGILSGYKTERPSYFEIMTAAAFRYFADRKVDIAVIETGLGGRLDSTNVIHPEACGITSISYDHTNILGSTLDKIAEEKAGIFKHGVPVVSAPQPKEVKKVLRRAAEKANCPIYFAGDDIEFSCRFESSRSAGPQARICVTTPTSHFEHLAVPLVGEHQAVNCGVAVGLLDQLKSRGIKIDDELAIAGLANVTMPGRMEIVCTKPRVLVDAAHNAASIEALMRAIGQNVSYDSMVVIFGCLTDKDVTGMLRHIQLGADKVIFTPVNSPRTADPAELAAAFAEQTGKMAQVAGGLREAMVIAEKAVNRDDLICITGSFYLVGEAKRFFEDHPHRPGSTPNPPL